MPLPAEGRYRLFLPPFPLGVEVRVQRVPTPMLHTPMGDMPFVPEEDVFVEGPTVGVRCLDDGHWEATLPDKNGLPVTLAGNCLYLGPLEPPP